MREYHSIDPLPCHAKQNDRNGDALRAAVLIRGTFSVLTPPPLRFPRFPPNRRWLHSLPAHVVSPFPKMFDIADILCYDMQAKTIGTEKYPRGRRGSPAKGVVRVNRSQGSNPCFSASKNLNRTLGLGSFYAITRRNLEPRPIPRLSVCHMIPCRTRLIWFSI